jgi:putative ABC transport system substrate-binding protein
MQMHKKLRTRFSFSYSGNRKAAPQTKIGNPKWKEFLALVLAFVGIAGGVEAQQPKKLPRIGYLAAPDAATESARADGMRRALRDLGYIEGQTIAIEYRYSDGKLERAPDVMAELLRLNLDLIVVAGGNPWVQAAKNATKSIPIVMTGRGSDPVKAGFVESLARPGGNVTGLTSLITELGGKRLELLKEAVPKAARVAMFYDPGRPSNVLELKEVQAGAQALKVTLQPWELRSADEFGRVFTALNKKRPDGLYVAQGPLMRVNVKRIAELSSKSRLPAVFTNIEAVDTGGFMSYAADLGDMYRRVAYYVDRILKGAKPADLPVEQPTKFELAFNLKTAKQIGVTIPQSLLYRADKVIR